MEKHEALRRHALDWIAANEARLSAFNARIWAHAEPAWREYESCRWYVEVLRRHGFERRELDSQRFRCQDFIVW